MRKITFLFTVLFVATLSFGQVVMKPLWEFSVTKANLGTAVDDVKNGFGISPDGTKLYLSARAADENQVAIYDAATGLRTGYLPGLAGFASNYGGDVAVDANGAIYASNVIIGSEALKVAKWDNETATPTLFISTVNHTGGASPNRIGYGMDVRINASGNGYVVMHKGGTSNFLVWEIENNVPVSQDPVIVTATITPVIAEQYTRISFVDDTHFWVDGNAGLPILCTMTINAGEPPLISAQRIATRSDINVGVGGATEFTLNGKRYGIFAVNNHGTSAAYQPKHHALVQEMAATGTGVIGPVLDKFPDLGLGGTTDYTHFVEILTHISGTEAYVYLMGGANGIAAFKTAPAKVFTMTAPAGTENVYIAGSFPGKEWKVNVADEPYKLTKTANANEFSGVFEASDNIEYKYLCHTDDWEYQEAASIGSTAYPTLPTDGSNRSYNTNDVVANWKAQPKVKLNVTINSAGPVPSNLFVTGSWNNWDAQTAIAMTASSTPLTAPGVNKAPVATNAVSYTGVIGNGTTDKIYSTMEYKYYTTDQAEPNWESGADGSAIGNRWAITPLMNDEIARFTTQILTSHNEIKDIEVHILRTSEGISVQFEGEADIELFGINGQLIDKTRALNIYSRDLQSGAYIIRVHGKSQKFVR